MNLNRSGRWDSYLAHRTEHCKPCRSPSTGSRTRSPKTISVAELIEQLGPGRQAAGGRGQPRTGSSAAPCRPRRWPTATASRSSPWSEEDKNVRYQSRDRRTRHARGSCKSAAHTFSSRLMVGTGKYASYPQMREALDISAQRVHHGGRPPRAADRRRGQESARFHRHGAATRSCRTRPAASRPRTPCAWPGWAAKSSRN